MVGGLFIFSGFIKANDPLGFSYQLKEYFEVFCGGGIAMALDDSGKGQPRGGSDEGRVEDASAEAEADKASLNLYTHAYTPRIVLPHQISRF